MAISFVIVFPAMPNGHDGVRADVGVPCLRKKAAVGSE